MMNTNGLFPIKMEPACKLKWAWSTIWLFDEKTSSCHRCDVHGFDIDKFDFHNTSNKTDHRNQMLLGKWPEDVGCEYCKHVELNDGYSDRMLQRTIPGYPSELDENINQVNINPTILEVYFDNKCNLSCVYCVPRLSSKIQAEIEKFGEFNPGFNRTEKKQYGTIFPSYHRTKNYDKIKKNFWLWMEKNSDSLQRFHIIGGEALFQDDFHDVIAFFLKHPNKDLELNIVSNLSIAPSKFKQQINDVKFLIDTKHVKRFDVTGSIDCWGEQQEYVRYGIRLDWFDQNLQYLLSQGEWLRLNLNHTVSLLTIDSMPILFEKILEWKQHKDINHYFGMIVHWDFLHPKIMNYDLWKKSLNEVKTMLVKSRNVSSNDWDNENAIKTIDGIIKLLKSSTYNDTEMVKRAQVYLNEIDRRRGTDWRATFPYLDI